MSEIKGQLLGIILVIMVFAAVGTAMVTAFKGFGTTVTNQANSAISEVQHSNQLKKRRRIDAQNFRKEKVASFLIK